jgi:transcriptional regulator with XRE-family HTH domain
MSPEEAVLNAKAAKRLKEDRKAKKYTQEQISVSMGVGLDHYKKMEAGKRPIHLWRLQKVGEDPNINLDLAYIAFGISSNQSSGIKDIEVEFNEFVRRNADDEERLLDVIMAYVTRLLKVKTKSGN